MEDAFSAPLGKDMDMRISLRELNQNSEILQKRQTRWTAQTSLMLFFPGLFSFCYFQSVFIFENEKNKGSERDFRDHRPTPYFTDCRFRLREME